MTKVLRVQLTSPMTWALSLLATALIVLAGLRLGGSRESAREIGAAKLPATAPASQPTGTGGTGPSPSTAPAAVAETVQAAPEIVVDPELLGSLQRKETHRVWTHLRAKLPRLGGEFMPDSPVTVSWGEGKTVRWIIVAGEGVNARDRWSLLFFDLAGRLIEEPDLGDEATPTILALKSEDIWFQTVHPSRGTEVSFRQIAIHQGPRPAKEPGRWLPSRETFLGVSEGYCGEWLARGLIEMLFPESPVPARRDRFVSFDIKYKLRNVGGRIVLIRQGHVQLRTKPDSNKGPRVSVIERYLYSPENGRFNPLL